MDIESKDFEAREAPDGAPWVYVWKSPCGARMHITGRAGRILAAAGMWPSDYSGRFSEMPGRLRSHLVHIDAAAAKAIARNDFDADLEDLASCAGFAGDGAQYRLCRRALSGDWHAMAACARTLAESMESGSYPDVYEMGVSYE